MKSVLICHYFCRPRVGIRVWGTHKAAESGNRGDAGTLLYGSGACSRRIAGAGCGDREICREVGVGRLLI